jgi:dTDP-4-dehydrorhamnose reductase
LSEGKKIKVVNDQYRTPTFVDDLSIAILKIAIGKHEGIWHISGKDYLSVYDFAVLIAKKFNFDTNLIEGVHSIELSEIAQRPAKTGFNIHKAIIELDYNPHNIQQAFDVIKKVIH